MVRTLALLTLLFAAAAVPRSAAAECTSRVSVDMVAFDLGRVESSWNNDEDAVRRATDSVRAAIPCLGEPLTPAVAARIHRAMGLRAWLDRKDPGTVPARLWFAAARNVEPDYSFPPDLVAPEDPERREYIAVPVGDGRTTEVKSTKETSAHFDGIRTSRRPEEWPTLYQLLDANERLLTTAYLMPGEEIPLTTGGAGSKPRGQPTAWLAGGASVGLLGAGIGMHVYNLNTWKTLKNCTSGAYPYNWDPSNENCSRWDEQGFEVWRASYTADIAMMIVGGLGLATTGAVVLLDANSITVGWSGRW